MTVLQGRFAAEPLLGGLVGHQQPEMLLGGPAPSDEAIEGRVDAAVRIFVRAYRRR